MVDTIQVIIGLVFVIIVLAWLLKNSNQGYKEIKHSKQSQSVKYGQMTEQFMPFLKNYPYDPQEFKGIYKPIDGIQFEEDKIIFVEFKTNKSRMSDKQKNIKQLIENGKVFFEEIRI